jgi:NTE family protein
MARDSIRLLIALSVIFASTFVAPFSSLAQATDQQKLRQPKVALVLGGGGTRGAAHIGVLKVFLQEGIPIDTLAGCSMGAIVGGLFAAGVSLQQIEHICLDGELKEAYVPGHIWPRALSYIFPRLSHPFGRRPYPGLFTGETLEHFLESQLPAGRQNIEDLPIPFYSVVTNLLDGRAYFIDRGKLSTAIRASAAMPPVLKPVSVGGKLYADGGLSTTARSFSARQLGADLAIAVSVDAALVPVDAESLRSRRAFSQRVKSIEQSDSDDSNPSLSDVVIRPNVRGIGLFSNNPEDFRRAIAAGEQAAREAMPEVRRAMESAHTTVVVEPGVQPPGTYSTKNVR